MKLTILQENLNYGLSKVSKFVDQRTQLPILANILFRAEKGKLKLTATNLESAINLWLPCKVEKEGKITLPAKGIVEFVSSLPKDNVDLDLEQDKLKILCSNYKAVFNGISAAEFPAVPSLKDLKKEEGKINMRLNLKLFLEAVSQIAFNAAIDETRPVLTGIKISFPKNEMSMAATDGYRLGLKNLNLKTAVKTKDLIIPAK
ncbi:DNA polymerase III subunit beta, partial [Candidatus Beckwithbacteria bacterium RBG_13_35_6]